MALKRQWVTPLMAGSFILMAVTGILMFFHWDSGLNKTAHEWLGWAMVIAAVLHITTNWFGFKNMFNSATGKAVIGLFTAVLALSFINVGGGEGGGGRPVAPINVLAQAPISQLAQISKIDEQTLITRLQSSGVQNATANSTVKDLVGNDFGKQIATLNTILKTTP
ncbi:MAG: hypothetical protein H6R05_742 [Burkholderiaceae bacterium]|nr:hypothetical protein [Burkholderiaceae bacterium]